MALYWNYARAYVKRYVICKQFYANGILQTRQSAVDVTSIVVGFTYGCWQHWCVVARRDVGVTVSQCDATWTFSDLKSTANQLEDNHVTWLDLADIQLTFDLHST